MKVSAIVIFVLLLFISVGTVTSSFPSISVEALSTTTNSNIDTGDSTNESGWVISNGKKYYYENGKKVVNQKKKIDGKLYLFGADGALLGEGKHETNGKTYYVDKKGIVRCNQWVASKKSKKCNTYYYADTSGKIITYEIKEDKSGWDGWHYVYIDGKRASSADLPHGESYYVFSKDVYWFDIDKDNHNSIATFAYPRGMFTSTAIDGNSSPKVYDFATQKVKYYALDVIPAERAVGSLYKPAQGGTLIGTDGYIYDISSKGLKKNKKASKLVVSKVESKINFLDGFEPTIYYFNNTNKEIKYVYFDVSVKNRVNDIVEDDISKKTSFTIKCTGPYGVKSYCVAECDAIMYCKSADTMVINSVKIEYMDGTSTTLKGSQVTL